MSAFEKSPEAKTAINMKFEHYNIDTLQNYQPTFWLNKNAAHDNLQSHLRSLPLQKSDLQEAQARWVRFQPILSDLFPNETPNGIIQSPLKQCTTKFQDVLGLPKSCTLLMKQDNNLPICGSVKARGGLYETFTFAEEINNNWNLGSDSGTSFLDAIHEGLMEDYRVVVGSTGNLGLSVGLAANKMGMQSTIHMSKDAKEWKKELLRQGGSTVKEHEGSYGDAVEIGRQTSNKDPQSHFIDDENSKTLFLGYACGAQELYDQLLELEKDQTIGVTKGNKKLVVHIPCGVGGAPSGICYGLKHVFGDNVTVFFAEPTHAPCVLLALGEATTKLNGNTMTTCADLNIDVVTEADGLACGAASPLCVSMVSELCDGIYTVNDDSLFINLIQLVELEGEDSFIEPSCCAALEGPIHLVRLAKNGKTEEAKELCKDLLHNTVHVIWATGGSLVPQEEREMYLQRGKDILKSRIEQVRENETSRMYLPGTVAYSTMDGKDHVGTIQKNDKILCSHCDQLGLCGSFASFDGVAKWITHLENV